MESTKPIGKRMLIPIPGGRDGIALVKIQRRWTKEEKEVKEEKQQQQRIANNTPLKFT